MTSSPANPSVPMVVGLRTADAMKALLSLGYPVRIIEQASTAVQAGMVVSMSPPAGTPLALGSPVEVTISTGMPA